MRSWIGIMIVQITDANLLNNKHILARGGHTRSIERLEEKAKLNTEFTEEKPTNRLQCFFHPRWINCRSRAQMQQRPAPGKGLPYCPRGCGHGKCVEKCLFGRCTKSCQCHDGWEGTRCNLDINDCRRTVNGQRTCDHRCVNVGGYYRCLCEEGYMLENDMRTCKRNKSLCDLKNCEMDCYEQYGSAHCTCPKPGLKLGEEGRSCVDENECEINGIGLCRTRETCVNFFGGYRCDCEEGYARQGQSPICTDIDECLMEQATCAEGTKCRNVPGFYQCVAEMSTDEQDESSDTGSMLAAQVGPQYDHDIYPDYEFYASLYHQYD